MSTPHYVIVTESDRPGKRVVVNVYGGVNGWDRYRALRERTDLLREVKKNSPELLPYLTVRVRRIVDIDEMNRELDEKQGPL